MAAYRLVRIERAPSGVTTLTLDHPPVNALGRELVAELGAAVAELRNDGETRCLVLQSGGKHFCAGADL